MGQSRQGDSLKPEESTVNDFEFIISRSEDQSLMKKTLFATLTGLAWLGWIYLWLPLLTLLAWSVGLDRAWKYLVVNSSQSNVHDLLLLFGIACTCAVAAIAWMTYNLRRFGHLRRRRAVDNTINDEIALKLGGNHKISAELRRNRHSVLYIDDAGNPTRVDSDGHWVQGTSEEHGYDSRPRPSENAEEILLEPEKIWASMK